MKVKVPVFCAGERRRGAGCSPTRPSKPKPRSQPWQLLPRLLFAATFAVVLPTVPEMVNVCTATVFKPVSAAAVADVVVAVPVLASVLLPMARRGRAGHADRDRLVRVGTDLEVWAVNVPSSKFLPLNWVEVATRLISCCSLSDFLLANAVRSVPLFVSFAACTAKSRIRSSIAAAGRKRAFCRLRQRNAVVGVADGWFKPPICADMRDAIARPAASSSRC